MNTLASQDGSTSARRAATLWRNASFGSTRTTSATPSSPFATVTPPYPPPTTATFTVLLSSIVAPFATIVSYQYRMYNRLSCHVII